MSEQEEVREEIEELVEKEESLSEWEVDFVESVSSQMKDQKYVFTSKQIAMIHKIWDKVCG